MKVVKTSLEGFLAIEQDLFKDDRSFFRNLSRRALSTGWNR
jgi:hypothetical protein